MGVPEMRNIRKTMGGSRARPHAERLGLDGSGGGTGTGWDRKSPARDAAERSMESRAG
jgi:hypothetical protein